MEVDDSDTPMEIINLEMDEEKNKTTSQGETQKTSKIMDVRFLECPQENLRSLLESDVKSNAKIKAFSENYIDQLKTKLDKETDTESDFLDKNDLRFDIKKGNDASFNTNKNDRLEEDQAMLKSLYKLQRTQSVGNFNKYSTLFRHFGINTTILKTIKESGTEKCSEMEHGDENKEAVNETGKHTKESNEEEAQLNEVEKELAFVCKELKRLTERRKQLLELKDKLKDDLLLKKSNTSCPDDWEKKGFFNTSVKCDHTREKSSKKSRWTHVERRPDDKYTLLSFVRSPSLEAIDNSSDLNISETTLDMGAPNTNLLDNINQCIANLSRDQSSNWLAVCENQAPNWIRSRQRGNQPATSNQNQSFNILRGPHNGNQPPFGRQNQSFNGLGGRTNYLLVSESMNKRNYMEYDCNKLYPRENRQGLTETVANDIISSFSNGGGIQNIHTAVMNDKIAINEIVRDKKPRESILPEPNQNGKHQNQTQCKDLNWEATLNENILEGDYNKTPYYHMNLTESTETENTYTNYLLVSESMNKRNYMEYDCNKLYPRENRKGLTQTVANDIISSFTNGGDVHTANMNNKTNNEIIIDKKVHFDKFSVHASNGSMSSLASNSQSLMRQNSNSTQCNENLKESSPNWPNQKHTQCEKMKWTKPNQNGKHQNQTQCKDLNWEATLNVNILEGKHRNLERLDLEQIKNEFQNLNDNLVNKRVTQIVGHCSLNKNDNFHNRSFGDKKDNARLDKAPLNPNFGLIQYVTHPKEASDQIKRVEENSTVALKSEEKIDTIFSRCSEKYNSRNSREKHTNPKLCKVDLICPRQTLNTEHNGHYVININPINTVKHTNKEHAFPNIEESDSENECEEDNWEDLDDSSDDNELDKNMVLERKENHTIDHQEANSTQMHKQFSVNNKRTIAIDDQEAYSTEIDGQYVAKNNQYEGNIEKYNSEENGKYDNKESCNTNTKHDKQCEGKESDKYDEKDDNLKPDRKNCQQRNKRKSTHMKNDKNLKNKNNGLKNNKDLKNKNNDLKNKNNSDINEENKRNSNDYELIASNLCETTVEYCDHSLIELYDKTKSAKRDSQKTLPTNYTSSNSYFGWLNDFQSLDGTDTEVTLSENLLLNDETTDVNSVLALQRDLDEETNRLKHTFQAESIGEFPSVKCDHTREKSSKKSRWTHVERRSYYPWSDRVRSVLKSKFNLTDFRPNQLAAINIALLKKDAIIIMPTAQPAGEEAVAVAKLYCKPASAQDLTELTLMTESSSLKLLYVSPEKLAKSKSFMTKLQKMYKAGCLARIAIDEVHCCSSWGHDFRPDYQYLSILKTMFPDVPILGLTATATTKVMLDVQKMLQIEDCVVIKAPFNRPNLFYEVRIKPAAQKDCLDELADLMSRRFRNQSGIIYTTSIKECEDLREELRNRGLRVSAYHAKLESNVRLVHQRFLVLSGLYTRGSWFCQACTPEVPGSVRLVHQRFLVLSGSYTRGSRFCQVRIKPAAQKDCLDELADLMSRRFRNQSGIIYTTSIKECEDLREELRNRGLRVSAYHAKLESNESGRAGRDGQIAHCILYYRLPDVFKLSSMVFDQQTGLANLYNIVSYCLDQTRCRRAIIASYFDEAWSDTECRGMCDHCRGGRRDAKRVDVGEWGMCDHCRGGRRDAKRVDVGE
ncbi:putative uncharacterized protein DDB_G0282133 [Diaphorina citri]|uniref:DNA 3'-5' helicase n=1 Tax=Diaphorina citri TaxID=121845 RepID=A0A3Q0J5C4_DIACI|nr:putative uncharacterized protein DDB_G0282133 [Diaphorina citri]